MDTGFSEDEIVRYSRQILLPDFGGDGQARLRAARVLVIGAGGLGSPLALYLTAAGVGHVTLVDPDRVDLSNLQRQVAYAEADIGRPKAEAARDALLARNALVATAPLVARLDAGNAAGLVASHDLVCDASDNFATRFLVADACALGGRMLVSAAVTGFAGQLAAFRPRRPGDAADEAPCYRCLHPEPPPAGEARDCGEAGVMGAACGAIGSMQALEAIKLLAGIGRPLVGRVLFWDGLAARARVVALPRDPGCPLCGDAPRWRDLSHHG